MLDDITPEYKPDKWVMLEINQQGTKVYKILAGWSGSYLHGQSWKLNSGCVSAKLDGDYFLFEGYSGSVYKCHKDAYGYNGIIANVLHSMEEDVKRIKGLTIDVLSKSTDFLSLDYQ
jgi:hypothetical protein